MAVTPISLATGNRMPFVVFNKLPATDPYVTVYSVYEGRDSRNPIRIYFAAGQQVKLTSRGEFDEVVSVFADKDISWTIGEDICRAITLDDDGRIYFKAVVRYHRLLNSKVLGESIEKYERADFRVPHRRAS
jgi:hypothetical protein